MITVWTKFQQRLLVANSVRILENTEVENTDHEIRNNIFFALRICSWSLNSKKLDLVNLSWQRSLSYRNQCRANQLTDFYMIGTFVMTELKTRGFLTFSGLRRYRNGTLAWNGSMRSRDKLHPFQVNAVISFLLNTK